MPSLHKYRCIRSLKAFTKKRFNHRNLSKYTDLLKRTVTLSKCKSYCTNIILSIISSMIVWVGCEIHRGFTNRPMKQLGQAIDKTLANLDADSPEELKLRQRLDEYLQSPDSTTAAMSEQGKLMDQFNQNLAQEQVAFNYISRKENQQQLEQIQMGISELLNITEGLGIDPRKVDSCLETLPFRSGVEATNQAIRELGHQGAISPVVEKLLMSFTKYLFSYSKDMQKEIDLLHSQGNQLLAGTLQAIQRVITEESSASLTEVYEEYKVRQGEEEVDVLKVFIESALVKLAFDEACTFYERLLKLAPSAMHHYEFADLLHSLGEEGRAMGHYQEALELYRKLSKRNPRVYKPYIAATLNQLGLIFQKNGKIDSAQRYYSGALKIYRQLAKYLPREYQPNVAMVLNNLGNLYNDANDHKRTKQYYSEALRLYRQLARQAPHVYQPHLASALNNVAIQLKKEDRLEEAKRYYEEALEIKRNLSQENPQAYLPSIALTLNNLAILLKKMGQLQQARGYYEQSLQIKRKLALQKPLVYLPSIAITLNNLGALLMKTDELAAAQAHYEEAIGIYRELVTQRPESYRPAIAMLLINLALLYHRQRQYTEAIAAYKEGMELKRHLAEQYPAVYELDYAEGILLGNTILGYSLSRVRTAKQIIDRYPDSPKAQALQQAIAEGLRSAEQG